jgi:VanZ family protein
MGVKTGMTFSRNLVEYWLPVVFWMAFIFWMSTETFSSENTFSWLEMVFGFLTQEISPQQLSLIHAVIRKAGHVTEYFVLGLLLFRSFCGESTSSWNWRWSFFAVMVVVVWAASDEFHQSFLLTRTASAVDVAIDTAAGILAQFAGALWYRLRKK